MKRIDVRMEEKFGEPKEMIEKSNEIK